MLKLTTASTNKVRTAVARAGPDASYTFDYMTQEAVIWVVDRSVPLPAYLQETAHAEIPRP